MKILLTVLAVLGFAASAHAELLGPAQYYGPNNVYIGSAQMMAPVDSRIGSVRPAHGFQPGMAANYATSFQPARSFNGAAAAQPAVPFQPAW